MAGLMGVGGFHQTGHSLRSRPSRLESKGDQNNFEIDYLKNRELLAKYGVVSGR
jgi:hypothetical protein